MHKLKYDLKALEARLYHFKRSYEIFKTTIFNIVLTSTVNKYHELYEML